MSNKRRKQHSDGVEFFLYKPGVVVPEDVTHVRVHDSVMRIPEYAFESRHSLKEVVLPGGLLKIGYGAYRNCSSLEHMTLPSTLTSIDEYACYEMLRLLFVEGARFSRGTHCN